jgi:hypothetical protein
VNWHPALEPFGGTHCNGPHPGTTEVLLHLQDKASGKTVNFVFEFKRFKQMRHFAGAAEVNVDNRPDHLDDRSDIFLGGSGFRHGKN